MIARIIIPIVILILLPDLWAEWRHKWHRPTWKRILWALFDVAMIAVGIGLAFTLDFVPEQMTVLNWFLFFVGLVVIPRALYCTCAAIGYVARKMRHSKKNWGKLVGWALVLVCWFVLIVGSTSGVRQLRVEHIDFYSEQLPAAFDGYRIAHLSDLHLGTYVGDEDELARIVDSVRAQQCDAVCFTGDIQNVKPQEIYPFIDLMSRITAKDGVFSILGNHDYSKYQGGDEIEKVANERETQSLIRQFGWTLLMNENAKIRRGDDLLVIAGMENWRPYGEPKRGDIQKTVEGIDSTAFTVMLAHEPTTWQWEILPKSHAQLTLSGHTHGGQLRFFGWSPMQIFADEWQGRYDLQGRTLYVSIGLGGVVPFRFDCPRTIYVITLRKGRGDLTQ